MSSYILKVNGDYACVIEADSLESAALLAEVSDEWSVPTDARVSDADDPERELTFVVGRNEPG